MNQFLKKYKVLHIAKIAGLGLLGLVVLAAAFRFIGSSFEPMTRNMMNKSMPSSYDMTESYGESDIVAESKMMGRMQSSGSTGGIVPPSPGDGVVEGDDAEDFEVTEYTARVETDDSKETCKIVGDIKAYDYVIFENASDHDESCNYRFKVKKEHAKEIYEVIEGLDPEQLSENTYTIKGIVDNYDDQTDILEAKKASIEQTLAEAIEAYDEITAIAKRANNAESLATVIDGKVRMIEKLTQERININSQLQRYAQQKGKQLDRLNYVYFNVHIYEDKIFDLEDIIDSWKYQAKRFVSDFNEILQDVTINLVIAVFIILQYALYLLIMVFVAKYGWRVAKYIWKK